MNLVTYEDSSRELQPYFHATLATIRAVGMVEYSRLYEKVYYAATQKPPYNHSEALYGFFKAESRSAALELPLLDASGLRDAWHGYSERGRFLQHVFRYLDRFYAKRVSLPDDADLSRASLRHAGSGPRAGEVAKFQVVFSPRVAVRSGA